MPARTRPLGAARMPVRWLVALRRRRSLRPRELPVWGAVVIPDLTAPIDNLNAECVTEVHSIRRHVGQLRCQVANWQPRDIPSKEEWDELPEPQPLTSRRAS